MKAIQAGGKPVDRGTEFFKSLKSHGSSGGKALYTNGKMLFQWDSLHGEWEQYDKKGYHRGVLDENGKTIKPAVKGRRINV